MFKQINPGVLLALVSALGFSSMAIFAKLIYTENINVTTVLTFRFLISAILNWDYL